MKLDAIGSKKIKPRGNFVAMRWLPQRQLKSKIIIPDSYYGLDLKPGKCHICEVLAVGPDVKNLKPKDKILVHEYGIKDWSGAWSEKDLYFIEEDFCKAVVTNIKSLGLLK